MAPVFIHKKSSQIFQKHQQVGDTEEWEVKCVDERLNEWIDDPWWMEEKMNDPVSARVMG